MITVTAIYTMPDRPELADLPNSEIIAIIFDEPMKFMDYARWSVERDGIRADGKVTEG